LDVDAMDSLKEECCGENGENNLVIALLVLVVIFLLAWLNFLSAP
jgi:hypothetical protein